jgi:PKD repeat protein
MVTHLHTLGILATSNDPTASYTYSAAGTYTVVLTVDDGYGGSDTASQSITVYAPPDAMHVEALEVKTKGGRYSLWSMKVTATVTDANNEPVAGATVSYFWSDTPGNIHSNCDTNKKGKCSVLGLQFRGTCLTFTVVDVSHSTLTYDPGQNNVNDISACK